MTVTQQSSKTESEWKRIAEPQGLYLERVMDSHLPTTRPISSSASGGKRQVPFGLTRDDDGHDYVTHPAGTTSRFAFSLTPSLGVCLETLSGGLDV